MRSSHSLLFSRLNKTIPFSLSSQERCFRPLLICVALSCTGDPRSGCTIPGGPHEGTVEGDNNLSCPSGCPSSDAVQVTIGLLGSKSTLLVHVKFFHLPVPVSPCQHSHSQGVTLYTYLSLPRTKCKTLHFNPHQIDKGSPFELIKVPLFYQLQHSASCHQETS